MSNGKLTVELPLPTLNDVLNYAKRHWSFYSIKKKKETKRIAWLARAERLKPIERPVDVRCLWLTKNRKTDPDNVAHAIKYVLDGLVVAKVFPNDTRKWIKTLHHDFGVDKSRPRVIVEWEEEDLI